MAAIVPDTLQGALIVSVIDFFLSFLIISGIGVVLSFFPLLNRVAKFINTPKAAPAAKSKAAPVARKPAAGAASDDIAAIAAAVFVAMDGAPYRIINIEPSRSRSAWVVGGRIAQHSSHNRSR